jgi:hypothetical protein
MCRQLLRFERLPDGSLMLLELLSACLWSESGMKPGLESEYVRMEPRRATIAGSAED